MSGKIIEFMKQQKYRFDFGTGDRLYTVIFHGKIPQSELKDMVSSLRNCLYEKMPETILLCLKQNHLDYSNFNCIEIPLEEDEAMDWTGHLLHSETYGEIDEKLGDIDVFYSVMDYQKNTSEGCCEGCYYALKRLSLGNGEYQHNLIGQIFFSGNHGCEEHGYFAIRESNGNEYLQDIDKSEGEPVLPTFGCVDMMSLLLDIETIRTQDRAMGAASR